MEEIINKVAQSSLVVFDLEDYYPDELLAVGHRVVGFGTIRTCGAGFGGQGKGHVGQHVEEVAFFGFDDALHLAQRVAAKALVGQAAQQRFARGGVGPQGAQFVFAFEEIGQGAEQAFQKLRG